MYVYIRYTYSSIISDKNLNFICTYIVHVRYTYSSIISSYHIFFVIFISGMYVRTFYSYLICLYIYQILLNTINTFHEMF